MKSSEDSTSSPALLMGHHSQVLDSDGHSSDGGNSVMMLSSSEIVSQKILTDVLGDENGGEDVLLLEAVSFSGEQLVNNEQNATEDQPDENDNKMEQVEVDNNPNPTAPSDNHHLKSLNCNQCLHLFHVLGLRNIEALFASKNIIGEDLAQIESVDDLVDLATGLPLVQLRKILKYLEDWKTKGVPKDLLERKVDLKTSRQAIAALQRAEDDAQDTLAVVQYVGMDDGTRSTRSRNTGKSHALIDSANSRSSRSQVDNKESRGSAITPSNKVKTLSVSTSATRTSARSSSKNAQNIIVIGDDSEEEEEAESDPESAHSSSRRSTKGRIIQPSARGSSTTPMAANKSVPSGNSQSNKRSSSAAMQYDSIISSLKSMCKYQPSSGSSTRTQHESFLAQLINMQNQNSTLNTKLGQNNAVKILLEAIDKIESFPHHLSLLSALFDSLALLLCCTEDLTQYSPANLRQFVHAEGFNRIFTLFLKHYKEDDVSDLIRSSWRILKLMGIYKQCETALKKQGCWQVLVQVTFLYVRNVSVLEECIHAIANGCIRKDNRDIVMAQRGSVVQDNGAIVDMDLTSLILTFLLPRYGAKESRLRSNICLWWNKVTTEDVVTKCLRDHSEECCKVLISTLPNSKGGSTSSQSGGDVDIQVLWALTNLTYEEVCTEHLLKYNLLSAYLSLLPFHLNSSETVLVIIKGCINLSCVEGNLVNFEKLPALCDVLSALLSKYIPQSANTTVLEEVCHVILNIAHNAHIRERLGASSVIELLIQIIRKFNPALPVVSYAIRSITNLANSRENQRAIGLKGACEILVDILQDIVFHNVSVKEGTTLLVERLCRSIANLAQHEENAKRFEEKKTVSVLWKAIHSFVYQGGVIEEACCSLAILLNSNPAQLVSSELIGHCQVLLRHVKYFSKDTDTLIYLMRILIILCDTHTDICVSYCLQEKFHEFLFQTLVKYEDEGSVVEIMTQIFVTLSGFNFEIAGFLHQKLSFFLHILEMYVGYEENKEMENDSGDQDEDKDEAENGTSANVAPSNAVVEDISKIVMNILWHSRFQSILSNDKHLWTVFLNIFLNSRDAANDAILEKVCEVIELLAAPASFALTDLARTRKPTAESSSSNSSSSNVSESEKIKLEEVLDTLSYYFLKYGVENAEACGRLCTLWIRMIDWIELHTSASSSSSSNSLKNLMSHSEATITALMQLLKRHLTNIGTVALLLPVIETTLSFQQANADVYGRIKGAPVLFVQILNIHHAHLRRYAIPYLNILGVLSKSPANLRQFQRTGLKDLLSKHIHREEIKDMNLVNHVTELLCLLDSESTENDEEIEKSPEENEVVQRKKARNEE